MIASLIHRETFCPLDTFSIAVSIHRESLLWTPLDSSLIAKTCLLNLDSSQSIEVYEDSIYRCLAVSDSFSSISLDCFKYFHLPNTSHSLQTSFPRVLRPWSMFFFTSKVLDPSFHHAFHILDLTFGIFKKFLDFSKSMKFLLNFWDGFCQNDV